LISTYHPCGLFVWHTVSKEVDGLPTVARQRRGRAKVGGERGIRTPGTLTGTVVFKTTAIDHSAISPRESFLIFSRLSQLSLLRRMRQITTFAPNGRTIRRRRQNMDGLCRSRMTRDQNAQAIVEQLHFGGTAARETIGRLTLDRRKERFHHYIEVFYNQRRRHSTLGQISPAEFERRTNKEGVEHLYIFSGEEDEEQHTRRS
jgi:hypothetical protein